MGDWHQFFLPALRRLISGQDPYEIPGFYNPPWLLFILLPFAWVPWWVAATLPGLALMLCAYHRKKWWLIPIVGLSFPFLALSVYGNVDWLPLIGLTFGGKWGPVLITAKPQDAGFALFAYVRRRRLQWFGPLLLAMLISFVLYPHWPNALLSGNRIVSAKRNLSLFPYSAPFGIFALFMTWLRGDILWGSIASLSLAPYFYIHSLVPALFLLADRKWWLGLVVSLSTWILLWASLNNYIDIVF